MRFGASIGVVIVALLHAYFMILEMFLWTRPYGMRVFGLTQEVAQSSKSLAMNQGLYNGFLAAGLLWGLSLGEGGHPIRVFFLSCVIIAGIFGALTANRKILYVQALPAAIVLALELLSR